VDYSRYCLSLFEYVSAKKGLDRLSYRMVEEELCHQVWPHNNGSISALSCQDAYGTATLRNDTEMLQRTGEEQWITI